MPLLLRFFVLLAPPCLFLAGKLPKFTEFVFGEAHRGPSGTPWADAAPLFMFALDLAIYVALGLGLGIALTPDKPNDPNPGHSPGQEN